MVALPLLANLCLGAPTAVKRVATNAIDSDDEGEHEPLDRRAYRKFPKLASAPDVTTLAKMPANVIEILVEQTAMTARKAQEPVRSMCEWMKALCRSAKLAGTTPGCEDHWYYLALAAFGFTPAPTGVKGTLPTLPKNSAFKSWREFFGALCEAFYGKDVETSVDHTETHSNFLKGEEHFWKYTKRHMLAGDQPDWNFLTRFVNPNTSQRKLDQMLNSLLEGEATQRSLVKITAEVALARREGARAAAQAVAYDRMVLNFVHWINELDSELSDDKRPWMAVVTLLVMRGADPLKTKQYQQQDKALHAIVMEWYKYSNTHFTAPLVDQAAQHAMLVHYETRQLERVRDLLDKGADPNYKSGLYISDSFYNAIGTRNEELFALILAHEYDPRTYNEGLMFLSHSLNCMFRTHYANVGVWSYSQALTTKLVSVLVKWYENQTPDIVRAIIRDRVRAKVAQDVRYPWMQQLWREQMPSIV